MPRFEDLSFLELVDLLAEKTSYYSEVIKEKRNTDEHLILRDEIQELLNYIERRREMDKKKSTDHLAPSDTEDISV